VAGVAKQALFLNVLAMPPKCVQIVDIISVRFVGAYYLIVVGVVVDFMRMSLIVLGLVLSVAGVAAAKQNKILNVKQGEIYARLGFSP
jgi:hypothetical protein